MKRNLSFVLASALALSLMLTACNGGGSAAATPAPNGGGTPASSQPQSGGGSSGQTVSISIGTGGNGGTYYILGGGMAQVIEKSVPNSKVVVEATAASTENARLVGTEQVQFAFNMPDGAYFATTGGREFEATGEKYENLRSVLSGHISVLQAFALKSSGITSIADLKGKTVALSAPSSPSMYVSMACLEAYGLKEGDYKAVYMSYSEMGEAVRNGDIDCGFTFGGIPTAAATELCNTVDTVMLGMDEDKADAILEQYPYFGKATIPADTFPGQTEDLIQLSSPAILITYADLDEELVYQVTKALWEGVDDLRAVHPAADEWILDSATENLGIDLHPGAERYYREVGVLK